MISEKKFTEEERLEFERQWKEMFNSSPAVVPTVTHIEVKNTSENKDGKRSYTVVQVNNLLEATRFINGFKPKRGYNHVCWDIKEVEVLV